MSSQIIAEFIQSRDRNTCLNALLKNTEEIPEIINLAFDENMGKQAEYASWILNHLAEANLSFFQGLEARIVLYLKDASHNSLQRQWLRILRMLNPDESFDSDILQIAEKHISNPDAPVALKAFSIHLLPPILNRYPELKEEILDLIDLHAEGQSPAYHSAAKQLRKKI